MTSRQADHYTYSEVGLDNVVLLDIEVRDCEECGDSAAVIPQMPALHQALAKALIHERESLSGGEVAFLRKMLDLPEDALAQHLGLSPLVQRLWEENHEYAQDRFMRVLLNASDRLLRVLVAFRFQVSLDIFDLFPHIKHEIGRIRPTFEAVRLNGVWAITRTENDD